MVRFGETKIDKKKSFMPEKKPRRIWDVNVDNTLI